ncbi:MAG: aspartate carbamoyltransferase [Candidatus Levybacteria bacterium RIFCSPHIGHO2_02_FULL_42_12]|nr:MAG: aspartate carbamoyltransferase [Candidatus Levybacteria bacterium RIFCSPHIGHO2_01_FULL_42_15]OGH33301.1 MAG: aspartate carbamoyltransferase [Candidatus Levybacteria bacterium RIFCSPHIGHO2_02_FULL_42_12]OGH42165.1 MAG: aspartate carbamoyltransferase [Candidatus Levybacteria bacterium RIFCSPLOWO2_01_FULL_42_15]
MRQKDDGYKINGSFKGKDIISLDQFSTKDLLLLFSHVSRMKDLAQKSKPSALLAGKIVTLIFYEPSSRTFGSFSSAIKRLGGQTVAILDPQHFSSVSKGETLEDTIRVFEAYSDAIVIRHPIAGTSKAAAEAAFFVPIINAGDGIGEHPTQALQDLYTIYKKCNRLDNLMGVMAGDILNGRTIHSLLRGLCLFKKNTIYLLSPKQLRLSRADFLRFLKQGIRLIEIESEKNIPKNAHFWYWTRVQKERFERLSDYEKVKNRFVVTKKLLENFGNTHLILMHPLPRVGEIHPEIDIDERAVYLRSQIRNGLYIRMALLALILGKLT